MYLQKHITKGLNNEVVSISNTYIHTYINSQTQSVDRAITQSYTVQKPQTGSYLKYNQYALLNLIMGDKHNYLVIVNPQNNKENTKINIYTHIGYVHIYDTHRCVENQILSRFYIMRLHHDLKVQSHLYFFSISHP